MLMVDQCTALGYRFPITWTLESATAAWNSRALAKLFADIVLCNNPMSGGQDLLLTADNHEGGSLYVVTKMVIEKFKKASRSQQQSSRLRRRFGNVVTILLIPVWGALFSMASISKRKT